MKLILSLCISVCYPWWYLYNTVGFVRIPTWSGTPGKWESIFQSSRENLVEKAGNRRHFLYWKWNNYCKSPINIRKIYQSEVGNHDDGICRVLESLFCKVFRVMQDFGLVFVIHCRRIYFKSHTLLSKFCAQDALLKSCVTYPDRNRQVYYSDPSWFFFLQNSA